MTIWQMSAFLIAMDSENQLMSSADLFEWKGRQTSMAPANTSREEIDWVRETMHQILLSKLYLSCQHLVVARGTPEPQWEERSSDTLSGRRHCFDHDGHC